MKKEMVNIHGIPAVIWGDSSSRGIIAVHGNMSHKMDVPVERLASEAVEKGYQVLSFDLPEHGERKEEKTLCKVKQCVKELCVIMEYAKAEWKEISLFANSMGAYFSLLAYENENLKHAWFLSPVVDMERIIENMMQWFQVTEEQLETEQTVATPIGQNLYWDYYCYVKEHPVRVWNVPTDILYGEKDEMCEQEIVADFVKQFGCELEIVKGAEHYFHTPEQLQALENWLQNTL